jgi:copper resistance protein B
MTASLIAAALAAALSQQSAGQQTPPKPVDPHAGHATVEQKRPSDLLPITEQDRRTAFPDVDGHSVHDSAVHYFVLVDQLEWQSRQGSFGLNLDSKGWIGGDLNRFWFRAEGEADGGRVDESQAHFMYGRAIARWWDIVAGVRQDIRPGPSETWAAVGLQGLAPYWFEVEATAYFGKDGRTHFRFETEYELLLTNRLILQPLIEIELYGKAIPERGIGAGLSQADYGLRLRYEIRRELGPYVGVTWNQRYFGTADFARAAGESTGGVRLVLGLRTWF